MTLKNNFIIKKFDSIMIYLFCIVFLMTCYIQNVDGATNKNSLQTKSNEEKILFKEVNRYGFGPSTKILTYNNLIYTVGGTSLIIYECRDPLNPNYINHFNAPSIIRDIALIDSIAVLLIDNYGINFVTLKEDKTINKISVLKIDDINPTALSISGKLLCIGTEEQGIKLVDISNILEPRLVDIKIYMDNREVSNTFSIRDVWIEKQTIYILKDNSELHVFELSPNKTLKSISSLGIDNYPLNMKLYKDMLYVAVNQGFCIVDLRIKTSPNILGKYSIGGSGPVMQWGRLDSYLEILNNFVYIAVEKIGLYVVDITSKSIPREKNCLRTETDISSVVGFQDSLILAADKKTGIRIINATNPINIKEIKKINLGLNAMRINYENDKVYLFDPEKCIKVLDVTSLDNIVEIEEVKLTPSSENPFIAFFYFNGVAYLDDPGPGKYTSDHGYYQILDFKDRAFSLPRVKNYNDYEIEQIYESRTPRFGHLVIGNLKLEGLADYSFTFFNNSIFKDLINQVTVINDTLFVANPNSFDIFWRKNSKDIQMIGKLKMDTLPITFDIQDKIIYLASQDGSLSLIDISEIGAPLEIKKIVNQFGNYLTGAKMKINNNRMFFLNKGSIDVYEFGNNQTLKKIGTINTPSRKAFDFEIVDNILFIADGIGGLEIIELLN